MSPCPSPPRRSSLSLDDSMSSQARRECREGNLAESTAREHIRPSSSCLASSSIATTSSSSMLMRTASWCAAVSRLPMASAALAVFRKPLRERSSFVASDERLSLETHAARSQDTQRLCALAGSSLTQRRLHVQRRSATEDNRADVRFASLRIRLTLGFPSRYVCLDAKQGCARFSTGCSQSLDCGLRTDLWFDSSQS